MSFCDFRISSIGRKLGPLRGLHSAMFSATRYPMNGDLRVAYRTSREGHRDLVYVPHPPAVRCSRSWHRSRKVRFETGHHYGQSTSFSTSRYQARARDQPEIASAYGSRPKTTVGADLPFSA